MAELGPAKLEAVNRLLRAVGEKPVAALDTGGNSHAGEAERVIDQATRTVQESGFEFNTQVYKALTAVATAITVPATTLKIKSTGISQHRHFDLQGDALFDLDNWTVVFGATETVHVQIVHSVAWALCPPDIKEKIIAEAVLIMQRAWRGNPARDLENMQDLSRVDGMANRLQPRPGGIPLINPVPPFQPSDTTPSRSN